jgi:putative addiction module CopG family antidote
MHVQLKPELAEFVDDQVKQGHYSSADAVLEAGVARLMLDPRPDELDAKNVEELTESLGQMQRGEMVDWKDLSAQFRHVLLT